MTILGQPLSSKEFKRGSPVVYVLLLFSVFLELFIFLIGSSLHIENVIPTELYSVHGIMFLGLVFIATFIMEILLVVILNRIGVEEQYSTNKNMIMRSYSLMAISAVVSFWIMETFSNILMDFTSIIFICFIAMHLLLNKRKI